jgi:dihydrofolate reductase
MTMSLDGFVAGEDGSGPDALEGDLYPDLVALRETEYMNAMIAETGAVLMGRRAYEMAEDPDWWVGNYEFQVPIFVVTHTRPQVVPQQDEHLTFTFVTEGVESAVAQAVAAAGDKAVTVIGGASVFQQALNGGFVDELHVDVMPVLLGKGLRLFDIGRRVLLEKIGVQEVGERTSLRFRVIRP